ncbi:MAG: deaminase [Robiginitomaculum sp.]|nr:MAG: deaminase [Robiginitomaculum sp.]
MNCIGHVYIASSLDGYIARLDGDLDWLLKQSVKNEDHGYDAFMESVDGLVLGRKSYEKVLSFGAWPYNKPVVVLSRVLSQDDVPEHLAEKVRITHQTPHDIMEELYAEGWRNAQVDGGKLIQSFLRSGLIDSLNLTQIPVLLGGGIPLFGALDRDINLEHTQTSSFPSGFVHSKYKIKKTI